MYPQCSDTKVETMHVLCVPGITFSLSRTPEIQQAPILTVLREP